MGRQRGRPLIRRRRVRAGGGTYSSRLVGAFIAEHIGPLRADLGALQRSHQELLSSHEQLLGAHGQLQGSHEQLLGAHVQLQGSHEQLLASSAQLLEAHQQVLGSHQDLQVAFSELRGLVVPELQQDLAESELRLEVVMGELGHLALPKPRRAARLPLTVVVITCDRPDELERALMSLREQSLTDFEVVIVNDGVTPVPARDSDWPAEIRVVTCSTPEPRSGPSVARNVGLDAISGEVVCYLDDDNEMWPFWLEAVEEVFAADPSVSFVYGAQVRFDDPTMRGLLYTAPFDRSILLDHNFLDTGVIAHRRDDIRWDPALRRLTDWDFALRATVDGREVRPIPRIASIYHDEGSRISTGGGWAIHQAAVHAKRSRMDTDPVCALCGFVGQFSAGPNGRPEAGCPNCGSLERHRYLSLILPYLANHLREVTVEQPLAVEIAPFRDSAYLFRHNGVRLITMDLDPAADGRVVDVIADVQAIPMAGRTLDLVLVSHVLEHVYDDSAAMREIGRVLCEDGVAIVQVPLRSDGLMTEEDTHASPAERLTRFGQVDHVRLYGFDIVDRLASAGLAVHIFDAADTVPAALVRHFRLATGEPYLLAHARSACAKDCWIGGLHERMVREARSLATYLGT